MGGVLNNKNIIVIINIRCCLFVSQAIGPCSSALPTARDEESVVLEMLLGLHLPLPLITGHAESLRSLVN